MAYTPELSSDYSGTLRRIAWAINLPMTTTLEEIIFQIAREVDHGLVCEACKDKSFCDRCLFSSHDRIT